MCAVLISVISCSFVADGWPGSNWWFWSNPFLIVPNALNITGTVYILTFHILLTSKSRSLYLLIIIIIIIIIIIVVIIIIRGGGGSSSSSSNSAGLSGRTL